MRPRATTFILCAILLWATALRLWNCDSSPRGLQIDEASNAWNAWCLLKTGQDEWGQRWPIFYTRAFDDYRSPLYLYLLLPFQAIGGMNVCTTRMPAAVGGIVTVLLVYYIGRRLFDSAAGLVAAAFVTLSPWHIQNCRWGHEGTIAPLLFAAAVAAMLWAGVPCGDDPKRPRAWAGFVAGLLTGVALYGYAALRLLIPVTMLAVSLAAPACWLRFARDRGGRRMILAIALGFAMSVGPLAWKHLTDSHINRRAAQTVAWEQSDSRTQRVLKVLGRYAPHFGPDFLFVHGTLDPALSPPAGYGWLHWYALPMLLIGTGAVVARARRSISARVLLAMLLAYPAGDLVFGQGTAPHPLRSFPGLIPLSLVAALGVTEFTRILVARRRTLARGAVGALGVWIIVSHALYLRQYFGPFNDDAGKYWQRHVDVMEACAWLKPRFDDVDGVFLTHEMLPFPHVLPLVFLEYDPRRWFAEPREYIPCPPTLQAEVVCARFGKVRLMYQPDRATAELSAMQSDDRRERIVLILRPRQRQRDETAAAEVRHGGVVWLYLYDLEI
jgi:4-amino-4-deoxy-L-arabinose transferase-like glycosyltransferase